MRFTCLTLDRARRPLLAARFFAFFWVALLPLVLVSHAAAQPVQVENRLVSVVMTNEGPGSDDSFAVALSSADGRYVLFNSFAGNLVEPSQQVRFWNVFLHDSESQLTVLVSRSLTSPTTAANGESFPTAISPDGEWVLFSSDATDLVPGVTDANGGRDVFLFQRSTGVVSLVSRSALSATMTGNGSSFPTAISADGEWVLFSSEATNLVTGITDSNGGRDAFLYQRSTGAVTLVSRSSASATTTANGDSFPSAISSDGDWVLFRSSATNLVPGVIDNNTTDDVFLYQRSTGVVTLVSRSAGSATTTANGRSFFAYMSADGEWVLFDSLATNLVPGVTDANGASNDVFLYERSTGTVSLVSRSAGSATVTANGFSSPNAISADGEWVLFRSDATNLVSGVTDSNGTTDVFLYQRRTGAVSLVSRSAVSAVATANGFSSPVAISADGEWVLFGSLATDLVPGLTDSNGNPDVFLYQQSTGEVTLVSRSADSAATTGNDGSDAVAISADGEWVLFMSFATDLVPGGVGSDVDVFTYRRSTGTVSLVSRPALTVTTPNFRSSPSPHYS